MAAAAALAVLAGGCSAAVTTGSGAPATALAGTPAAGSTAAGGSTHGHAAPTGSSAPLGVGERFTTLTVPTAYMPRPPNGGTDEYRCFLVDPELRGAGVPDRQPVPAAATSTIVHHAIFFRVAPAEVAAGRGSSTRTTPARAGPASAAPASAATTRPARWRRLGGGLGAGRPGEDAARRRHRLPAAARQPARPAGALQPAQRGRPGRATSPGIRLRLAPGTRGTRRRCRRRCCRRRSSCPARTGVRPAVRPDAAVADVARRFGAGGRRDRRRAHAALRPDGPPGPGPTQSCDHRVTEPGTVVRAGRAHAPARHARSRCELNPGRPGARTLLDVTRYNFHDQRSVPLPGRSRVKAGDMLRVTCTHDASLRPHAARGGLPPRYVRLGRRHHRRDVPRDRDQGLGTGTPVISTGGAVGSSSVGLGHAGRGQHVHRLRHGARVDRADRAGPARRADAELEVLRGRREAAGLVGAEPVLAGAARR